MDMEYIVKTAFAGIKAPDSLRERIEQEVKKQISEDLNECSSKEIELQEVTEAES